jgi:prepilin-type N-terminal cleavage/methylation domain-containing protein
MMNRFAKQKGFTLVEMLMVMVVGGIFLMTVLQTFNAAFQSFQTNYQILATRNYHAQVDYLFELLENEIGNAGSMQTILKHLDDPDDFFGPSSITVDPTDPSSITFQYAVVERILLKKGVAREKGADLSDPVYDYYFPLFSANLPTWNDTRGSWWIIGADRIHGLTSGSPAPSVLELIETPFDTEEVRIYGLGGPNDWVEQVAATVTTTGDYEYIFLIVYDTHDESFQGVQIDPGPPEILYSGELIARTSIFQEGSIVKMAKTIPSNPQYTIGMDLLQNVELDFSLETGYLKVELNAKFPGYRQPIEIRRTRYFWYYK